MAARSQGALRLRDAGTSRMILFWTALAAAPSILDLPQKSAGIGLIALVVVPVFAIWISKRTLLVADPVVIIGLMWVLAAGLPALFPGPYSDSTWMRTSQASIDMATLWMYRGWAACVLLYWIVKSVPNRTPQLQSVTGHATADRLRVGVGLLGLAASLVFLITTKGQAYSHLEGFSEISTLNQIIHELRQFALIYVFLYFFARGRGRLFRRERWLFYGVMFSFVLIFASAASKGVVLGVLTMWLLGTVAGGQRGNFFRELLLGLVLLVVVYWVFLGITAYRVELNRLVNQPAASFSEAVGQQIEAASSAFGKVVSGEPVGGIDNPYDSSSMLNRLGLVISFATVIDISGGVSPHENAFESFLTPFYAIMPRNVFGDKAQFLGSGELAAMLGWSFGGFSVSLPGSLYWAWGLTGILPAMAALGAGLAFFARRSERDDVQGLFAKVLLTCLVLSLINVGNPFQPVVISLVRTAAFLWALRVTVRLVGPRRSQDAINRRMTEERYRSPFPNTRQVPPR